MNAIPMLEACFRHQWLYTLWNTCRDCGIKCPSATGLCATCALKAEVKWVMRRAA